MSNKDFTTTILVDQTAKEAFNAINSVSGWWTENVEGEANKLNGVFTTHFGETFITMKVVELVPGKKVVWLVTDCYKDWVKGNKKEWNGTEIVFEDFDDDDQEETVAPPINWNSPHPTTWRYNNKK